MTGYSCDSIITSLDDSTLSQLLGWNTWLGDTSATSQDCTSALFANMGYYDTRAVCIGVGEAAPVPSSTSSTGTAPPAPTQTGVVPGCREFYVVQEGDYCYLVTQKFSISLDDFVSWNPSGTFAPCPFVKLQNTQLEFVAMVLLIPINGKIVGDNCENLWLGYAYCVKGP